MMNRRTSEQISAALGLGFVIDDALIALELYDPNDVAREEPNAISELRAWLERVKEMADEPSTIFASQDLAYAPYSSLSAGLLEAEAGWGDRPKTSAMLGRIIETLEALQEGTLPQSDRLAELKAFLQSLSRALLEAVEERTPHSSTAGIPPLIKGM